eukprot:2361260-Rhodomonas_salina.2
MIYGYSVCPSGRPTLTMGRTCLPATKAGLRQSRYPSGSCNHPTSYPALMLTGNLRTMYYWSVITQMTWAVTNEQPQVRTLSDMGQMHPRFRPRPGLTLSRAHWQHDCRHHDDCNKSPDPVWHFIIKDPSGVLLQPKGLMIDS